MSKLKIPDIKVTPPGSKSEELLKIRTEHIGPAVLGTLDFTAWPCVIEKGEGSALVDVDGNVYIDFLSGMGVCSLGNRRPEVVRAAKEQLDKLGHCFSLAAREKEVRWLQKLAEITGFKRHVEVTTGSEATEGAIRLARAYTGRPFIIALGGSYHGLTHGALSITGKAGFKAGPLSTLVGGVHHLPQPHCYRCPLEMDYPGCDIQCAKYIERLFEYTLTPTDVAAVIAEPIQSEAGVIIPPKEYHPWIKKKCEENGILFIADEIYTGFCRTGKWWGIEHYGVKPDMMTLAKAITGGITPLSAISGRDDVLSIPILYGSTFMANSVSCAASLAAIEIMQKEALDERAAKLGEYALKKLKDLVEKSGVVGEVRGKGLLIGVEIVKDKKSKEPDFDLTAKLKIELAKRGVLVYAYPHANIFRIVPPLTIEMDLLDKGLDITGKCIMEYE